MTIETKRPTPQRLTREAANRMAEMDYDPLEMAVMIARGDELKKEHPFLRQFEAFCDYLRECAADMVLPTDMELLVFYEEGTKALAEGATPIELRARHNIELLKYVYPQKKAIEHDIKAPPAPWRSRLLRLMKWNCSRLNSIVATNG